uniref:Uncharacterized protein n=1 Tax=Anguilla anguilla TaxID=7936 RepID=A0A0E9SJG3_ANGAN
MDRGDILIINKFINGHGRNSIKQCTIVCNW